MDRKFKIYLAASARDAHRAAELGSVSLMAYKLGQGFHLYRTVLPASQWSLMDVDCTGFTGYGPHRLLIGELMEECSARRCGGIVMDIGEKPNPSLLAFLSSLDRAASSRGVNLFLPLRFGEAAPEAVLLVPAFCDRGSLRDMLHRIREGRSGRRLSLVIDSACTEYPFPSSNAAGRALSREEFDTIRSRHRAVARYSRELCASYFTYTDRGRTRMVLWDDGRSVEDKLRLAASLGYDSAFLYFPHLEAMGKNGSLRHILSGGSISS